MPDVSEAFIQAVSDDGLLALTDLGFLTVQFCVLEDALNWFCTQLLAPLDIRIGEAMVLPLNFEQKIQRSRSFIERYEALGLLKKNESKQLQNLLQTCKTLAEQRNDYVHGTVDVIEGRLHFSRRSKGKPAKVLSADAVKPLIQKMHEAANSLNRNGDAILKRTRGLRKSASPEGSK